MNTISLKRPFHFSPFGCLFFLIIIVALCHTGTQSPYTYVHDLFREGYPVSIDNVPMNWDTPNTFKFIYFFASGNANLLGDTPCIKIPIYHFLIAVLWRITHNLFLSILLLNVTALVGFTWYFCKLAARYGLNKLATTIIGALFITSLWITHYIAQPLPYVLAVCFSFFVVLFFILEPAEFVKPWQDGFLLSILFLLYDPYPYFLACLFYIIKTYRYKSVHNYLMAAISLFLPIFCWNLLITTSSSSAINQGYYEHFMQPVFTGWMQILSALPYNLYTLYIIGNVTLIIAVKQVLAQIYWPILLLFCYWIFQYQLWKAIPKKFFLMSICLIVSYFFFQFFTAAFDWENNPRRAFPIVLAIFLIISPGFKIIFKNEINRFLAVGAAITSILLSMADFLFNYFNIAVQLTGQFVTGRSKFVLQQYTLTTPIHFEPGLGFKNFYNSFYPQSYLLGAIQFTWFWFLASLFCLVTVIVAIFIIKNHLSEPLQNPVIKTALDQPQPA